MNRRIFKWRAAIHGKHIRIRRSPLADVATSHKGAMKRNLRWRWQAGDLWLKWWSMPHHQGSIWKQHVCSYCLRLSSDFVQGDSRINFCQAKDKIAKDLSSFWHDCGKWRSEIYQASLNIIVGSSVIFEFFKIRIPEDGGGGVLAKYEIEKVWLARMAYQSMCIHCHARGIYDGIVLLREDEAERQRRDVIATPECNRFETTDEPSRFSPEFFTSCDSKNDRTDWHQPLVRKVLSLMLCGLTDVRHAPSEPPAKITPDGDWRERV